MNFDLFKQSKNQPTEIELFDMLYKHLVRLKEEYSKSIDDVADAFVRVRLQS